MEVFGRASSGQTSSTRIRILGSGTAFNTDGRGCQAVLLEPGAGAPLLLDVGPDTLRGMAAHGVDPGPIDAVFITHLHGDHIVGWPFLLLHWIFRAGRSRPVDVYGPRGISECLAGLARLSYGELLVRPPFEIRYHELPPGESAEGTTPGGVRFEALPVVHHPSSLGYRFEVEGRRIALSGDTEWCDNLVRLSRGTDAAIVECTDVDDAPGSHLALSTLRARAGELETARLVLVHLTDAVARALAADPLAGAIAAYDGLAIDL